MTRATSPISFSPRHHVAGPADISRLLDPAYSGSKPRSAFASTSAYVDPHGDIHDPDYRHFPVVHSPTKRHSHPSSHYARPRWELFDEDAYNDDDDEEQDLHLGRGTFLNTRRQHASSTHRVYPSPTSSSSTPSYAHNTYPTYTPNSLDSDNTVLSDDDEADFTYEDDSFLKDSPKCTVSRLKFQFSSKKQRRSLDGGSSPSTPTTTPLSEKHHEDDVAKSEDSHFHPLSHTLSHTSFQQQTRSHSPSHHHAKPTRSEPDHEYVPTEATAATEPWTPTCSQVLKRQWQAVALSVRFGVFRAQRKMKSRLALL